MKTIKFFVLTLIVCSSASANLCNPIREHRDRLASKSTNYANASSSIAEIGSKLTSVSPWGLLGYIPHLVHENFDKLKEQADRHLAKCLEIQQRYKKGLERSDKIKRMDSEARAKAEVFIMYYNSMRSHLDDVCEKKVSELLRSYSMDDSKNLKDPEVARRLDSKVNKIYEKYGVACKRKGKGEA